MKKLVFLILILILLSGFSVFLATRVWRLKRAEIDINTIPETTVFINGKEKGVTPYKETNASPGQKVIRLVPKDSQMPAWERSLTLTPGTQLIIRWEFSSNPDRQQGDVIYLEKTGGREMTGLILTSKPTNASVSVDNQINEFSPVNLNNLSVGDHKIVVSYPGYQNREFLVKAIPGHRLVIETKLAIKETEEQPKKKEGEEFSPEEIKLPQVVIKDTPTGWLRVRTGPSLSATEAARVKPGEKYTLLEEESGWYKILYEEDKEGWISGRYAEKLTED